MVAARRVFTVPGIGTLAKITRGIISAAISIVAPVEPFAVVPDYIESAKEQEYAGKQGHR
jgi:hypothetical protein